MDNYLKKGKLSKADALDPLSDLDDTDYALYLNGESADYNLVDVRNAFRGVCVRNGTLSANTINVSTVKEDAVVIQSGGSYIGSLHVVHDAAFIYDDLNHSDVLQAYSVDSESPFEGLDVLYANANVFYPERCGFMFTEKNEYRNVNLFQYGLDYKTDNYQEWFLQATNFVNSTIGSPNYPIDPDRVNDRGIWIGSKPNESAESKNVTIHAYDGLNISVTGAKATGRVNIIRYPKNTILEERLEEYNSILKVSQKDE